PKAYFFTIKGERVMNKFILVLLAVSMIVILGCGKDTETVEDKEASKDEVIVQTQETVGKSEVPDIKEKGTVQEIFITIKEGKFEPDAFEVINGEKVRFRVKSLDVQHTFTVAALEIKEMVNPGEEIIVEAIPNGFGPVVFRCDIHGYIVENGEMFIK
ncbi:cupredoxin domain-containing protein, partial [Thermodesulfobacteriota bacterium]